MKFNKLKEALQFARELTGSHQIFKLGKQFDVQPEGLKKDDRNLLITIENEQKTIQVSY